MAPIFSNLAPARAAAATLVTRLDLAPPVPVHDLVRERAELIEVNWDEPNVDAVMLRQSTGRPRVFYKVHDLRGLRERFTLGHELGHLVLPWQLGNSTCFTGENGAAEAPTRDEAEADLFASCLLAPDRWLTELTEKFGTDMDALLDAAAAAQISSTATLLALRRILPAGWAFQINAQPRAFISAGTSEPGLGPTPLRRELDSKAKGTGAIDLHGNRVSWWRLTDDYILPDFGDEAIPLRELLLTAIGQHYPTDDEKKVEMSVNGIVGGGAKDLAGRGAGEIYASLRYRFESSSRSRLLSSAEFEAWLSRKARAIAEKPV